MALIRSRYCSTSCSEVRFPAAMSACKPAIVAVSRWVWGASTDGGSLMGIVLHFWSLRLGHYVRRLSFGYPAGYAGVQLAAGGGNVVTSLGANTVTDTSHSQLVAEGANSFTAWRCICGLGSVYRNQIDVAQLPQR